MSTVVCTEDYAKRLIGMKGKGMVPSILKLVITSSPSNETIQAASAQNLDVHTYDQVLQAGETDS